MQPVLTPERFRTMRTGAVLTGYSNLELAETIADATAIANAYCNNVDGHSFRGGSVVNEEHLWAYPEFHFDRGTHRVYLYHYPVRTVTGFTLLVGAGASAAIPTNSLVINHSHRYVEVTSLAIASNSGLFGVTGWIVPIGGMEQPMAQVSYTYGQTLAELADAAYPITDTAGELTYQVSHGYWTDDDVVVYVDSTEVPDTGYTLNRTVGRITFDADPNGTVTVDYSHEMGADIPRAVAHITAHLVGASKMQGKGLIGDVRAVKVGEISINRGMTSHEAASYLVGAVPAAALLLDGHKMFWMA